MFLQSLRILCVVSFLDREHLSGPEYSGDIFKCLTLFQLILRKPLESISMDVVIIIFLFFDQLVIIILLYPNII